MLHSNNFLILSAADAVCSIADSLHHILPVLQIWCCSFENDRSIYLSKCLKCQECYAFGVTNYFNPCFKSLVLNFTGFLIAGCACYQFIQWFYPLNRSSSAVHVDTLCATRVVVWSEICCKFDYFHIIIDCSLLWFWKLKYILTLWLWFMFSTCSNTVLLLTFNAVTMCVNVWSFSHVTPKLSGVLR